MSYIHWIDVIILLACCGALYGALALVDLIGGRK